LCRKIDCFASLAIDGGEFGQFPAQLKSGGLAAIHPFFYDNAEFYLRNIVTSGSKSCLMGFMSASYKFYK
jgi:hypothetical protein